MTAATAPHGLAAKRAVRSVLIIERRDHATTAEPLREPSGEPPRLWEGAESRRFLFAAEAARKAYAQAMQMPKREFRESTPQARVAVAQHWPKEAGE